MVFPITLRLWETTYYVLEKRLLYLGESTLLTTNLRNIKLESEVATEQHAHIEEEAAHSRTMNDLCAVLCSAFVFCKV